MEILYQLSYQGNPGKRVVEFEVTALRPREVRGEFSLGPSSFGRRVRLQSRLCRNIEKCFTIGKKFFSVFVNWE